MLISLEGFVVNYLMVQCLMCRNTFYLRQSFREGNADSSFLHLLLEVLDAVFTIIISSSDGPYPGPAKVQHQLGHSCRLVQIVRDGP